MLNAIQCKEISLGAGSGDHHEEPQHSIALVHYCQTFFELFRHFFGHFDTNRSMIPLSVPEISPWAVFVTDEEEELGILVVG